MKKEQGVLKIDENSPIHMNKTSENSPITVLCFSQQRTFWEDTAAQKQPQHPLLGAGWRCHP